MGDIAIIIDILIRDQHATLQSSAAIEWWRRADWTAVREVSHEDGIQLHRMCEAMFARQARRAGLLVEMNGDFAITQGTDDHGQT